VLPVYPRIAQLAKVEGDVLIEAIIGPDGRVREARLLRSISLLDEAALEAVRAWEYSPTLLNGQPVAVIVTVTVRFRLN
jgi:protein TonB